MLNLVN